MKPKRVNVKERVSENGEIDLSMSDLQDVPVKDIAVFKKVYSLDLSNNHLKTLPPNFATLTHITKLDLSKNQLKELPENFGDLIKLKHLDLYQNNLEFLPLSFSKLRSLKWLDLKDNPLTPTVAKVAGQCLDAKQCQTCAKDVVNFFVQIQEQVASDIESRTKNRQRQLEINQQKQKEQNKAKKKEKNKQNNKQQNGPASAGNKENSAGKSQNQTKKDKKNADAGKLKQQPKKSSLSILKLLVFFVFFTVLALFILASFAEFQQKIKIVFDEGVKLLPPHLQTHALTAGAYVKDFHGQTVNVTVNFVNTVRNNEQVVLAANTVRRLSEHLQNRVKELFGS